MGIICQVYVWLIVYPASWLITILCALASNILSIMGLPNVANKYVARFWARAILLVTPVRTSISGLDYLRPGQSYVIVCNHQSVYDILVLYGWFPLQFRWVMKQELRRMPFIGYACYKMGHIFVDRSNRAAAKASMEKAKKKISAGVSILFFPEGTRSKGDELLPFKKGAYKMAKDMQLPILPVSIKGANRVMPANSLKILPGKIQLFIHEPITKQQVQDKSIEEMIQSTRDVITKSIGEEA